MNVSFQLGATIDVARQATEQNFFLARDFKSQPTFKSSQHSLLTTVPLPYKKLLAISAVKPVINPHLSAECNQQLERFVIGLYR